MVEGKMAPHRAPFLFDELLAYRFRGAAVAVLAVAPWASAHGLAEAATRCHHSP